MAALVDDLKYGFRLLRQTPGFTAVAVCALALGIGGNTAIFSTVDSVLLRPLPYQDPDKVVLLWEDASFASFPKNTPAPGNYSAWKERNQVFTDIAAAIFGTANLTADGPPEQVLGRRVTANFFHVLGVRPILGRTFTDEEDRAAAQVVLLSYRLWQGRYLGDPGVVGKAILMNGAKFTVIGVLRRDFVFRDREMDYWSPSGFTAVERQTFDSHYLNVVARLKPGVTLQRAREDMNSIALQLQQEHPRSNYRSGIVVAPIKAELLGNTRLALLVLMSAAGCVLLIACANLASLLTARAVVRQREMAVRAALEAGRGRLIRQLVTEGMLLSLGGGAIGLWLASAGMKLLGRLVPVGLPGTDAPGIDSRVLAFALVLSLITGVLFSILPAMQSARAGLNESLKQSGRSVGQSGGALRDVLVVFEVAAALVLLVGAGLMLQTLAKLQAIDIGFRPDHLLTMRTVLPKAKYKDPSTRRAFYDRVVEQVRALPGVEGVAFSSNLPFTAQGNTQGYRIEGRTQEPGMANDALLRVGTSGYLKMLGVRLLEGRLIEESDGADARPLVVVINETFAKRHWPNESPLGHRISLNFPTPVWRTIVGVVADVRERGYELEMKPGAYLPHVQFPDTWALPDTLAVRTKGDPQAFTAATRAIIASVDPEQPIAAVRTMDDILRLQVADREQQMALLGSFAGLAVLLASIGLYGVLSYSVVQRSREIGLRMALGASASNVTWMVVGRGLSLAGLGLGLGLAGAWGVTRAMKNLLFGIGATDPTTFGAVVALLAIIALVACWIPARRASRLDPILVLRQD